METLAHSQVSLTLDTYSHVLPSLQAEAGMQMDRAIGCQTGCQEDAEAPAEAKEGENSLGKVVTQIFTSWNRMSSWLSQLRGLQRAA
jgi:hypothetical protein